MNDPRTLRILYALCAIAFVVIVARAYMNVKGTDALVATLPQSEVQAFARQELDELQNQSFASDRELCGIIFEDKRWGTWRLAPIFGRRSKLRPVLFR